VSNWFFSSPDQVGSFEDFEAESVTARSALTIDMFSKHRSGISTGRFQNECSPSRKSHPKRKRALFQKAVNKPAFFKLEYLICKCLIHVSVSYSLQLVVGCTLIQTFAHLHHIRIVSLTLRLAAAGLFLFGPSMPTTF
jgi:hypothetical protein